MKFSYSSANLIFFGFLIILLILPIFDRHKLGKFQKQKALLGGKSKVPCSNKCNKIFGQSCRENLWMPNKSDPWGQNMPFCHDIRKRLNQWKCSVGQTPPKPLCSWAILIRLDLFALLLPNYFTYNAPVGSRKPNFNGRSMFDSIRITFFETSGSKLTTNWIYAHKRTDLPTLAYITMY